MAHPEVPGDGTGDDGRPSDGCPIDPRRRSDLRLVETAIRQRWPIPDSVRFGVVRALVRVIEEAQPDDEPDPIAAELARDPDDEDYDADAPPIVPKSDARVIVGASRVLVAIDKLNLDAERFDHAKAAGLDANGTAAAAADLIAEAERLALEDGRPCPPPPPPA